MFKFPWAHRRLATIIAREGGWVGVAGNGWVPTADDELAIGKEEKEYMNFSLSELGPNMMFGKDFIQRGFWSQDQELAPVVRDLKRVLGRKGFRAAVRIFRRTARVLHKEHGYVLEEDGSIYAAPPP